jgi:iron complex transport system substrate-binding protein
MRRFLAFRSAEVSDRRQSEPCRRPSRGLVVLVVFAALGLSDQTNGGEEDQRPPGGVAMRIVSLAPSVTEILFGIDAGDRLVGVSSFCDYPAEVAAIPRVGTFTKPSIEAILAARPDLVIAARGPATMNAVASVRGVGVPVLVIEDVKLADVWKAIEDIGRHTGRAEAAARLEDQMRRRFDAVRSRLAGAPRRRVLVVVGQTPLIVAGVETFVDDLIRVAGGVNVAADTGQPWPRLSLETVLARAPEVIIDSALSHEDGADAGFWSRFSTLPAVREGRVHAYRSLAALRGGPRLADAAEEFARLIHPERYGATDGEAENETSTAGPAQPPTPAGAIGTTSHQSQPQWEALGEQ